jgi:hypothetical protein
LILLPISPGKPPGKPSDEPHQWFDINEVHEKAYPKLDEIMHTMLHWLNVEAGLEFEEFCCDFAEEEVNDGKPPLQSHRLAPKT